MYASSSVTNGLCGLQDKGVEVFTGYVRNLIAERAREEYSALVESTGTHSHSIHKLTLANCHQ